jgi:hypothetical protein
VLCQSIPKLSKHFGAILALLLCDKSGSLGREAEAGATQNHNMKLYELRKSKAKESQIEMYIHGVSQYKYHLIVGGRVPGFHTAISASLLSSSAPPTLPSPSSLSCSPFFPPASSAQDSSIQPTMRSLAIGNML